MIPLQAQLIAGVLALAIGFGGGWKIQSWRWDASTAALEREHSQKMVQAMTDYQNAAKAQEYIASTYETEKANAKRKTDTIITGLRNRSVILRDPAGVPACPAPPAGPGIGDGSSGAELSEATSRLLLTLAGEADELVTQLSACQAVLRADRKESATSR